MKNQFRAAAAVLFVAVLAACGGGGGGGGAVTPPAPVYPSTSQGSAAITAGAPSTAQLGTISNGSSASVTLPAASGAANATLTLQSTLPAGGVAPQALSMSKSPKNIGGSNLTVYDYVVLSVDQTISITQTPAFTFTLPQPLPTGASAYIAVLDIAHASNGWNVLLGPAVASGNTLTFAATQIAPPLTITKGDTYVFALVSTTAAPSTPAPISQGPTSYSGTKTVNFTFGYSIGYPTPAPHTTAPPNTQNYTVVATATAGASPFPASSAAPAGVTDEHVSETDSSNLVTSTFTTDAWVGQSNGNVLLYGQTQQEPSSANAPVITTLFPGGQTIDKAPEAAGTWTNGPTSTEAFAYADGNSGTRTVASNGTYADVETIGGSAATMTENADGSGSITGPFFGGGIISSIQVTAPSPRPSASPLVSIVFNYTTAAQSAFGLPPTQTTHDYVWYPWTQGSAINYYTETDGITVGSAVPTSCAGASYKNANDVNRTISILDTILGNVETITQDAYNVDGVPVCLVTSDVVNSAYDWLGDNPYQVFLGTTLGLVVQTTNETLVLQNAPAIQGASPQARSANALHLQSVAKAIQANQLATFTRERMVRTREFVQNLHGGVR